MNAVSIIGAGHQGLAMAAHLEYNGVPCFLWNRNREHIASIIEQGYIDYRCPIFEKPVKISKVSYMLPEVISKLIMVTTPSSAHSDIARMLAPYVDENYTIILNPGRTFGVLAFAHTLKESGCTRLPKIAETQSIIYTCRRNEKNSVTIYALKNGISIAALDYERSLACLEELPSCIKKYFVASSSYLKTTLDNMGMVLHCAPVLMNVGWIESKKSNFEYYYDGISPSIANLLEQIDAERCMVAKYKGIKAETIIEWLKRIYHTKGQNLYEHLQSNIYYRGIDAPKTINHRYIEEDIPNGLVAIESLAHFYRIEVPTITAIIDMANIVMRRDWRKSGRDYRLLCNEIE